jgi:transcriptional regulator with XRE-family HTH domain
MIYQRLKILRKKHGETLEQWEELTGISKSAISRIENGKQSGTFEELGIFLEKVARNQEEKDFLIYGKTPKRDKKEESLYTTYLEQQLQKANDDIIWLKRVVELQ